METKHKPAKAPALAVRELNGQAVALWAGDYQAAIFPTHALLANELVRRNNAYPQLVAALRACLMDMQPGVDYADHIVNGHALLRSLGEME